MLLDIFEKKNIDNLRLRTFLRMVDEYGRRRMTIFRKHTFVDDNSIVVQTVQFFSNIHVVENTVGEKNPVVENHPTRKEIKDLLPPRSTPTGNTVYFHMSSSLIYILEIHRRSFKHNIR